MCYMKCILFHKVIIKGVVSIVIPYKIQIIYE